MKKVLVVIISVAVMTSCGSKKAGNKKEQLDKLKQEQATLTTKIKTLEEEIAKESKGDDNTRYRTVTVSELAPKTFTHYLEIQGKIDAEQNITISARVPANVSKVLVKTGDDVKQGQLLAELDNSAVLAGLDELKSGLSLATILYEKQKSLWDQKIGSEVQYLQAKNAKEQLEKKMISLNETLDMYKIVSPINGTVDEVQLRVGQSTAPGVPGIRIVNMNDLKAKAEVAEAYAGRIKQGNDAIISMPDIGKNINAKITFAGRVINTLNRTFTVEAKLDGVNDLHPNMLAILKIIDYKSDTSLTIPINTVQNSDEGQFVMVAIMNNGKPVAQKKLVKLGKAYNGVTEILSGLEKGDKVLSTGYVDLNNGDALIIK